ncbi:hypothetical protein [Croceimicrobium hydrocarbonivorans]|uniref:Uncharacterized protein n=1 Tax=Croceimicrobium hydrocarbonivorans TaxID=2761580 RepID=A0A7H0VFQ5_9FLAO|nr:hypothetical protein [Croceimicrobium hydrocarbonivorans]QNR24553.1 hypothetical protein H4K34_01550 [Croceimicrobium hydrocarbonivorans]
MIAELTTITSSNSFPEMCTRMGAFLGMNEPVPENAMRRAIKDDEYANNLITCRNSVDFLQVLLNDPLNESFSESIEENTHSNGDLALKAVKAMFKWGKAGFSVVDDETLERRENACLSCEHLVKPNKSLQKLVVSQAVDKIGKRAADCTCKLCGCSISKKIKIPTESCPGAHLTQPGYNRWGEKMPR